jgi:ferrous iron transport protein B
MGIRIALAGNPNSGKTTLFNALTGSNQYVGNWPGVTVEKKEGTIKKHPDVTVIDLPGIYSLSPYALEEVIARDYLVGERPDVILNIVDGTNIERNLYLTTQLTELGIPVVVAVNMMDIVRKSGDEIDTDALSKALGARIVKISALKGTGIDEAIDAAIEAATAGVKPTPAHIFSGVVEHALAHIEEAALHNMPSEQQRWYAIKIFERDKKVIEQLKLSDEVIAHIEEDIRTAEAELDDDSESIITNERYIYISSILKNSYKKKNEGKLSTSEKIDRIVTNRFLALPIFALIMVAVYYIAVTSVGTIVTDFTNEVLFGKWIMPGVASLLKSAGAADWVISLVVDGIIGGISAPIGFAPQMAVLFLLLSFLEDWGYMARVAFIMDKIFRRFGLSGKSFIPLLVSSGCGVLGIMATKTIENEKDRRLTMMTTTMIPCGAKLPVIALIAGAIMGGSWWMAPLMYFVGIAGVVISCIILKKTKMFSGDPAPFIMELPQYHLPSIKKTLIHVWDRIWHFLKKAGTVLFLCCVVMWLLGTLGFEDGKFGIVHQENSLMSVIGGIIAPIFIPLGFGFWQAVAASLSGFFAKEAVVSTIAIFVGLVDLGEEDPELWGAVMSLFPSAVAAVSFLVFNLLNSPCIAAVTTLSREMNSRKWTLFAIIYQNVFAYVVSLMIYQFGSLITGDVSFGVGTVGAVIVLSVMLYLMFRKTPDKKMSAKENKLTRVS